MIHLQVYYKNRITKWKAILGACNGNYYYMYIYIAKLDNELKLPYE